MLFKLAANFFALFHLAFILFILFGGLLLLKWPRVVWIHVPAAVWGALIEFAAWECPLTRWENLMLRRAVFSVIPLLAAATTSVFPLFSSFISLFTCWSLTNHALPFERAHLSRLSLPCLGLFGGDRPRKSSCRYPANLIVAEHPNVSIDPPGDSIDHFRPLD